MTMPDERTRSVIQAREFLTRLVLSPSAGGFSRVGREVRAEASRLLRHFPHAYDLVSPGSWDVLEVDRHYSDSRDAR